LKQEEIKRNLDKIVALVQKNKPDIITFQEVDEGSVLSGSFNQFEWLAKKIQYPHKYFAPSCAIRCLGKPIFVSGNAIFSRHPLQNCESYKFAPSFPTDRMGFVVARVELPDARHITVVSAHLVYLDWTRRNSRATQLQLLQNVLATKPSVIVAGDFNCDYSSKENLLLKFGERLGVQAFDPNNASLATYPSWSPKKRIDWILASKGCKFESYRTLEHRVSDHLAVFTTISS
jgi:endonuclease/exonuclease/phosphatase family metal-dependent hydrolase